MKLLKPLPNPTLIKLFQVLLAIGYVALFRQLLALQSLIFGEGGSVIWRVTIILVVVLIALSTLFLINYIWVRNAYVRLGLLASIAIFAYYYIYNPYYISNLDGTSYLSLFYLSIIDDPSYLLIMFLLVGSPYFVGKILSSKLQNM